MALSQEPRARAAQLANLRPISADPEKARAQARKTGFGAGSHKQCTALTKRTGKRCKKPAAHGTPKCRTHGALLYAGTPSNSPERRAWGIALTALWERRRDIPMDLMREPVWYETHFGNYPRKLAILTAWECLQNGDPGPWRKILAEQ